MKKVLICLTISLALVTANAQTITWRPGTKLSEKDFKGSVSDSTLPAFSNILMVMDVKPNKKFGLVFLPTVIFDAEFSFINPAVKKGTINTYMHERTRFDLAQLTVYEFIAELDAMTEVSADARNKRAMELFHKYLDIAAKRNTQYDAETYGAESSMGQSSWDNYVDKQLSKYQK